MRRDESKIVESSTVRPVLLKKGGVAKILGCSEAVAAKLMAAGTIPAVRIPGTKMVRTPESALTGWIANNTLGA